MTVLMLTLCTPMSFAASNTKSATAYSCIKEKNTAYVTTYSAIYKVNLKTKKAKKLVSVSGGDIDFLQKKGKYLYYGTLGGGYEFQLSRVNVKTGKTKLIAESVAYGKLDTKCTGYVVKDSKIYYSEPKANYKKSKKVCVKLNGKSKKSTKYKAKMKHKVSNAKGYRLSKKEVSQEPYEVKYYLKTPKGRIYLGTGF